jgi:hypothetical protein
MLVFVRPAGAEASLAELIAPCEPHKNASRGLKAAELTPTCGSLSHFACILCVEAPAIPANHQEPTAC